MIVGSFMALPTMRRLGLLVEESSFFYSSISSIFSAAGVALLMMALVESVHLKKSLTNATDEVVRHSTRNMDEKFNETFRILSNKEYNGLIDILPPRQDLEVIKDSEGLTRGAETKRAMEEEIKRANFLRVLGISSLDFFRRPQGARAGSGDFYSVISEKIKKNKSFRVEALLIHPKSEAAKFRNLIETFDNFQGDIEGDIEAAVVGIKSLNAATPFIEYRFYSVFPQIGFILTDECVVVEPYHSAPTEKLCDALEDNGKNADNREVSCTGGRIPVFKFKANSNVYLAVNEHFESIWEISSKDSASCFDLDSFIKLNAAV